MSRPRSLIQEYPPSTVHSQNVVRQEWNVFAALPQRGHWDLKAFQSIVEILPELTASHDVRPGRIEIVPDVTFFLRGDAKGDESVNLADTQRTIEWLFRGGREPSCLDAADANDDGEINLADPVFTLRSLFTAGASLPQPYPDRGVDPTADPWECGRDL